MTVMENAQILWDYHQLHHEPLNTDIAIGLGSHDIGVAEHAAELWHKGRFPLIVFTGANAPTTIDAFPRGEAVHYAERAKELGVPADAILLETRAENTGENFRFARRLLNERGIHPHSCTVISRPYQQRRAYATARKLWPDLEIVCSARSQTLNDYITSIADKDRVLNMLVGDTERIWRYAEAGYAEPQKLTPEVLRAFEALVESGYTRRLIG